MPQAQSVCNARRARARGAYKEREGDECSEEASLLNLFGGGGLRPSG